MSHMDLSIENKQEDHRCYVSRDANLFQAVQVTVTISPSLAW